MTSPRDRALDFYFDFISPYAYLAFTQLPALRQRTGAVIRYQPVLFAGLLGAHGQLGPAEIPAKRAFVGANIMRIATRLGILGQVINALTPRFGQIIMNTTFRMFPDSAAAKGKKEGKPEMPNADQIAFTQLLRGLHF